MHSNKQLTTTSKFISLVLCHKPETIGLQLDENGWADTATLIQKMNLHGQPLTVEILNEVVRTNSKQRFAFNDSKTKIRASQGHSLTVDLNLPPTVPPAILYHGTAAQNITSIMQNGLQKQARQHVHLSTNTPTATQVGSRHGKPALLIVDAAKMHHDGYTFFISENGVWLTEEVPAGYLKII